MDSALDEDGLWTIIEMILATLPENHSASLCRGGKNFPQKIIKVLGRLRSLVSSDFHLDCTAWWASLNPRQ